MDWRDSAAENLPPARPDDPPSLRRDIADELGDHLDCAFARERQRADDESARRAVLERFGDPQKIARRLWLDATWEAVMNQRILLATCAILAAACVAIATFSFLSLRQTRQANELTQKANEAVLSKLDDLSKQALATSPWSHLTVRVRRGTEDGPPVEGVPVMLDGQPYTDSNYVLTAKTDSIGICRFGPVRRGQYVLVVGRASGRLDRALDRPFLFSCTQKVLLDAAQHEKKFAYPDPAMAKIGFSPDVPNDLQNKNLVYGCSAALIFPPDWLYHPLAHLEAPRYSAYFDQNGELYETSRSIRGELCLQKVRPPGRFVSQLAVDTSLTHITVYCLIADGGTTAPHERIAYSSELGIEFSPKPDTENVVKIEFPEQLIKDIRAALPRYRLEERIPGRLIRTVPIEEEGVAWDSGGISTGSLGIANLRNVQYPIEGLVRWADLPQEEAQSANRRFILALYSRETNSGMTPSKILVHEVLADWPMKTPNLAALQWSPEPSGQSEFERYEGWKTFDVTELVRSQARDKRPNHGVLLRFMPEVINPPRTIASGALSRYDFVTMYLTKSGSQPLHRRPRLLVIEPAK